jgi:hypothetical protein
MRGIRQRGTWVIVAAVACSALSGGAWGDGRADLVEKRAAKKAARSAAARRQEQKLAAIDQFMEQQLEQQLLQQRLLQQRMQQLEMMRMSNPYGFLSPYAWWDYPWFDVIWVVIDHVRGPRRGTQDGTRSPVSTTRVASAGSSSSSNFAQILFPRPMASVQSAPAGGRVKAASTRIHLAFGGNSARGPAGGQGGNGGPSAVHSPSRSGAGTNPPGRLANTATAVPPVRNTTLTSSDRGNGTSSVNAPSSAPHGTTGITYAPRPSVMNPQGVPGAAWQGGYSGGWSAGHPGFFGGMHPGGWVGWHSGGGYFGGMGGGHFNGGGYFGGMGGGHFGGGGYFGGMGGGHFGGGGFGGGHR